MTDGSSPPAGWPLRVGVTLVAGGSIAALLAELYGVASMASVFWSISVPSMLLLVLAGVRGPVTDRVRVGAIGGLLGTIAYDLFRVPFLLAGMRVFAPISSYGLMATAAEQSSGFTNTVGWLYHLSNGVSFGVVLMLFAAGRSRWWAVGWGVMLETVAFLGPFTARYGLTGRVAPIVVAFAAHVAYGYPLGLVAERFEIVADWMRRRRFVVTSAMGAAVVGIVVMFSPWSSSAAHGSAVALAEDLGEPVAVLDGSKFVPEWLRVPVEGCVVIVNPGSGDVVTGSGTVPGGDRVRWCFDEPGVYRIKVDGRPFSGGFVMVDD